MAINVRPLRNVIPSTGREEIHLIVDDEEDLGSTWLGCIKPEEVPTTAKQFFKTVEGNKLYANNTLDNMLCFITNEYSSDGDENVGGFRLMGFDGKTVCEINAKQVHDFWTRKGVA